MVKTKKRPLLTLHRVLAMLGLGVLIALSYAHPLSAQTVTQGYGSDELLQRGMIVQLKKKDTTKVEPVGQSTAEQIYGVVVNANDAPVTLSAEGQKVYVAKTGHFDVLVSDQNGTIAPGDYITISAINGIGMKAGTKDPFIIGRALAAFDAKTNIFSSPTIKNSDNQSITVHISRVQTDISVARNPLLKASEPNLPSFLKKATEQIAGKPVSPVKAYISVAIFIIAAVVAGILMYGGVRSGIISIGRNPLSRKSIIRGMLQVVITGLIVFISGVFGVYLLLKL